LEPDYTNLTSTEERNFKDYKDGGQRPPTKTTVNEEEIQYKIRTFESRGKPAGEYPRGKSAHTRLRKKKKAKKKTIKQEKEWLKKKKKNEKKSKKNSDKLANWSAEKHLKHSQKSDPKKICKSVTIIRPKDGANSPKDYECLLARKKSHREQLAIPRRGLTEKHKEKGEPL